MWMNEGKALEDFYQSVKHKTIDELKERIRELEEWYGDNPRVHPLVKRDREILLAAYKYAISRKLMDRNERRTDS